MTASKKSRPDKGASIISFPKCYTIIDLETTGLSPECNHIIEIGAIQVEDGEIVEVFQQLVNPGFEIDDFIQNLTGITNDMLLPEPNIQYVLPDFDAFVRNSIVVGHNVNFDINFLYDDYSYFLKKPFSNGFVDTMRIARRLLPDLEHHRLVDVVNHLGIQTGTFHRALADCEYTYQCYEVMKKMILEKYGTYDSFSALFKKNNYHERNIDLTKLVADPDCKDEDNPLYGKVCVFTGMLQRYTRQEAAQIVVNIGGTCGNSVTKKTNYLIMGNNDYCASITDGKSTKQKRAEAYKLKGQDIEIIPESVFYDMIGLPPEPPLP